MLRQIVVLAALASATAFAPSGVLPTRYIPPGRTPGSRQPVFMALGGKTAGPRKSNSTDVGGMSAVHRCSSAGRQNSVCSSILTASVVVCSGSSDRQRAAAPLSLSSNGMELRGLRHTTSDSRNLLARLAFFKLCRPLPSSPKSPTLFRYCLC